MMSSLLQNGLIKKALATDSSWGFARIARTDWNYFCSPWRAKAIWLVRWSWLGRHCRLDGKYRLGTWYVDGISSRSW